MGAARPRPYIWPPQETAPWAERPTSAQRWFADGYVLTVDDEGLRIEVTDYHAKPLQLSWGKLGELGLERTRPATPRSDEAPTHARAESIT